MGARRHGGGRMVAAVSVVAVIVGCVLLGIALLAQEPAPPQAPRSETSSASAASSGASPQQESDGAGTTTATEDPPGRDGATPMTGAGGAKRTAAGDASAAAPLPASEPIAISVPDRDIAGDVFRISLDENGTLPAPRGDRHDEAAWFDGSPTPGERGPAVIEGHVTYSGKRSVFFELGSVRSGDRVDVARADGTTAHFEVYRIVRQPKDEFPTWAVYGNTTGPELRLITCGGDVDASGHHADNVVVFARLLGA